MEGQHASLDELADWERALIDHSVDPRAPTILDRLHQLEYEYVTRYSLNIVAELDTWEVPFPFRLPFNPNIIPEAVRNVIGDLRQVQSFRGNAILGVFQNIPYR
jgi:hypothetical protein